MSEPQRWARIFHKQEICIGMKTKEDGDYVKYEDYAILKKEIERLQSCVNDRDDEIRQLNEEIKCIQACFNDTPPSEEEIKSHCNYEEGE